MVADKKKKLVENLTKAIQNASVVALVNMQNLPAQQLQNIRSQLYKKNIQLTMTRKNLLNLALKNSKISNVDQLIEKIKGMPALLLANENPFTLYSILQKNKSSAPAKANQESPKDIIVPAGATNFAPGPIISELANVGIKTKVDGGKLAIIGDTTVAKEGDIISAKLAELLKRLDIKPMEIGLNLVVALEKGTLFDAKQLHIDEEEYYNNIILACQEAFNLSVEVAYPTKDNVEPLLQKAFRESKTLALEQEILTDETTEEILAKSERQALSLKDTAKIEVSTEVKKVEKKEETKEEEKKPEVKGEKPVEKKVEDKKEETVEEKPVEEALKVEEKIETKEEPKQEVKETVKEEKKQEEKVVAPKEEKPVEKKEEPKPVEEEKPVEETPKEEKKDDIQKESKGVPSAEEMIKQTKEKFEKKEEVKTEIKGEVSAENLVKEEKRVAEKENPKDVKEAEQLFEKLKKEGTLRT